LPKSADILLFEMLTSLQEVF